MQQLKVRKKNILAINLIIFLLLSFTFLYLQYAYRYHLSPFSLVYLQKSIELFWYIAVPLCSAAVLIWRHHFWSAKAFAVVVSLVSYKVTEGLFIEFNKMIVIALFCHVVIAYFLFQLFAHYLSLASLNANYASSDLFDPLLKKIECTFGVDGKEHHGWLTNWDEEGCFIQTKEKVSYFPLAKVIIEFQGRQFQQQGEVVAHSLDLTGVGIKFGKSAKSLDVFNWSEFNDLIEELGFRPERLR
jgi:hypothetical protein